MKYCVIVPDGAADRPVAKLGNRTPLEAARTPNMDRAARGGLLGMVHNVPPRMTPGSAVAMLSVIGYDPREHFTGRGPLEAADLGLQMGARDWAVRCNLVTVSDDNLVDFTAGHVSSEEAAVLIEALNEALGNDELSFHVGTSYRHVLIYRGEGGLGAETTPPHDIVGQRLADGLPRGTGADVLTDLMRRSQEVLESHEVNQVRLDLGKNPANMIWLWSPGPKPRMESFQERFGLRGAVISAVNLVRGIGTLIGWEIVVVPGATGYTDTDYAAKGRYAIDALLRHDLALVHVEAPDEASHEQDVLAKVRAIEQIDRAIVGPIMSRSTAEEGVRLLIVPDHITSVEDGRHKRAPVPFAMWGEGVQAASGRPFTESDAGATDVEIPEGHSLMAEFVGHGAR